MMKLREMSISPDESGQDRVRVVVENGEGAVLAYVYLGRVSTRLEASERSFRVDVLVDASSGYQRDNTAASRFSQ